MEEINKKGDVKKTGKKVFKFVPWLLATGLGFAYYLLYKRKTEEGFVSEYYLMHSLVNLKKGEIGHEVERA